MKKNEEQDGNTSTNTNTKISLDGLGLDDDDDDEDDGDKPFPTLEDETLPVCLRLVSSMLPLALGLAECLAGVVQLWRAFFFSGKAWYGMVWDTAVCSQRHLLYCRVWCLLDA